MIRKAFASRFAPLAGCPRLCLRFAAPACRPWHPIRVTGVSSLVPDSHLVGKLSGSFLRFDPHLRRVIDSLSGVSSLRFDSHPANFAQDPARVTKKILTR